MFLQKYIYLSLILSHFHFFICKLVRFEKVKKEIMEEEKKITENDKLEKVQVFWDIKSERYLTYEFNTLPVSTCLQGKHFSNKKLMKN